MELSEVIEKCRVDDVFFCEGPRPPQKGSLALIGHHLIFSPAEEYKLCGTPTENGGDTPTNSSAGGSSRSTNKREHQQQQEFWLLHRAVDRVLVEPVSRDPNARQGAFLRLKCKNFMHICFELNDLADCQAVARSIETLSNLSGIDHDYPFYYRCPFTILDNGWEAYTLAERFAKLQMLTGDRWRISSANGDFQICPSYPQQIICPKGIGDDYLRISATFRDGGRFPVLSYYHHQTRSTIYRCGQPLIGPTNRRCKEDEVILNSMLSKFSKGLIFDTRAKLIAQTSRGKGGGCESQMYYSQWKYVNGNAPRIRELREALTRLTEACVDDSNLSFYSRLAISGWLQHVMDSLTTAATVAQVVHCMDEGTAGEVPVLVHGGEGTDSTLLVTSLAQLLLDPDARTIRGFQSLVEHEWALAGHPFSLRCAHSAFASGTLTGPHESPVFLCFLDCVWQLMRQFPSAIEFNQQFLIFLFEHAYASEFGTFLGNNEQERHRIGVKERTVSLWSYVNHPNVLSAFLSPIYEPHDKPLWPSIAPQSILLWERMFFRWQRNWADSDRLWQVLSEWKMEEKRLVAKLTTLQQQSATGSRSISACSTITSTDNVTTSNNSYPIPSQPNYQKQLQQQQRGLPISPPAFALEEVVKMDQLNIRQWAVSEEDGNEDEYDMLESDGSVEKVRSRAVRNSNSAAAVLDGARQTAKQLFQKIGGPSL